MLDYIIVRMRETYPFTLAYFDQVAENFLIFQLDAVFLLLVLPDSRSGATVLDFLKLVELLLVVEEFV